MRAIVITEPGPPSVMEPRERPDPTAGAGQIVVRVHGAGVNRADLMQRRGLYPAPPGWPEDVPGLEYAGVVESVGAGVTRWSEGDRVMGLVGGGGYAERVVVHERMALRVPEPLTLVEAAAVPEVFITAHDALFTRLGLRLGEWLLIHAVGSGVGTAALQLAKQAGATVIGTSRTRAKLDRATEELGLDHAIDASAADFAERVLERTGGRGVDAVLDLVGAAYLAGNLRALAPQGRQVVVGLASGNNAEIDLRMVLSKRLTLVGTALRSRPLEQKIEASLAVEREVGPLLESGAIRPVVDRAYPLSEAAAAHEQMERNENFGKIVLTLD